MIDEVSDEVSDEKLMCGGTKWHRGTRCIFVIFMIDSRVQKCPPLNATVQTCT
jgi:hypothetical protein